MDALRPLSLDQFAAMTAEMEAGFPRDRVLADASVSAEQWELTQETWLLRMAKQGQQRKLALLDRYNELLAKHRKAAQRKMRAEKRRLKGPMPVAPEAHVAPLARAGAENGTGATFQQQGVATAPGSAWVVTSSGPGVERTPAGISAPPVVGAPAMVTPPQVAAPPMIAAPPRLAEDHDETDDGEEGGTIVGAAVDMSVAPAWLEANRAAAEPHAGPAWMAPKKPSSALSSTARVEDVPLPAAGIVGPTWLAAKPPPRTDEPRVSSPPAAAPAAGPAWLNSSASFSTPLPASPPAGDGHAAARAETQPAAPAPNAPPPRRPAKGATLIDQKMSDFMPPAAAGPAWLAQGAAKSPAGATDPRASAGAADALPFQRGAQPAPPAAQPVAGAADALPFQRGAQPAPLPAAQPAAGAAAMDALPFQRSAQPPAPPPPAQAQPAASAAPATRPSAPAVASTAAAPAPRLSIEQLAWLQAQVETSAELGRAAREKLGLSEAEYAGERAFWQARFQQDRATVERYSQLFYHYKRGR